jgi:hypothetical protein
MDGDASKWLTFIQLPGFVSDWKDLELDDEDLRELEMLILRQPEAGVVVSGTGGLRKVRFSPSAWRRGKSGAIRVGYVSLVHFGAVVFLAAFAKNEQANFSSGERNAFRQIIAELKKSIGG